MNISQALKKKNRLAKEIANIRDTARSNNSILTTSERKLSTKTLLDTARKKMYELVDLKTAIHKANMPVYDKIFLLSEYKTQLASLRTLDTTEGISEYRSEQEYAVEIDIVEKLQRIKDLEELIDELQDELDYHNATAKVTL